MRRWFYPLSMSFVIAFGLGSAHADPTNPATGNRDWGQVTKEFTRVDDGQPGIGDHSRDPPGFEPGEGGREGVGNVTKDVDGPLSEGGQGEHANRVGGQMGISPDPRPGHD
jgi:hypothetical protein